MTHRTKFLIAAALACTVPLTSAQAQAQDTPDREHTGDGHQMSQGSTEPRSVTGKVTDVWKAPVRDKRKRDDTIVLIETSDGHVIFADMGPTGKLQWRAKEDTPAVVTGAVMSVDGERRFVPQAVSVGREAKMSTPPGEVTGKQTVLANPPQKRQVSGKIIERKSMNAKETGADHELAVIEIGPKNRMVVDFGPKDQLKGVTLGEGESVQVEGHQSNLNEGAILLVDQIEAGGRSVTIKRDNMPIEAR